MKRLAVFALLAALGGCAAAVNPNTQAARDVCAVAYGDPALTPIRDRIPIEDDAATMASMNHLADTGKPNDTERQALQLYDSANRRCWDAWDQAGKSPIVQSARSSSKRASTMEVFRRR